MFYYGEDTLSVSLVKQIEEGKVKTGLSDEQKQRIEQSRNAIEEIVRSDRTVYGINTGFGILANTKIAPHEGKQLQYKILQSHSCGVGSSLSKKLVRIMLITKIHALAKAYSGVQLQTIERLRWHLEQDIIPVVPSQGSVGSSGDLAPLSHMCLPLIGLGHVLYQEEKVEASKVLQQFGLKPIELSYKEGLALINGTQFMLAHAVQATYRMEHLLNLSDVIAALSIDALMGSQAPFGERFHALRPYPGVQMVAERIRNLLHDSPIGSAHLTCDRVQDPYSLRCVPQVHGASRNAWLHLQQMVEIELNAVTDNPVIFSEQETVSGGHFHGQPIALPMDYACFAVAELGNISDRRTYLLIEGKYGLPTLLMNNVGLNSGFMIPQYVSAALVSENKTLCFPASADSIPTSLGQEDHVSMGSISGRKLNKVLDNVERILAIELLNACQALDFRKPLQSTPPLMEVYHRVRQEVSFADEDRIFAYDIDKIYELITSDQWFEMFTHTST